MDSSATFATGERVSVSRAASAAARGGAVLSQEYGEVVVRVRLKAEVLGTAVFFTYCVWGICAMFTFVYGMQVYTLYGESAEKSFTHDWAVGLGIEQATQLNAAFKAAVQGAILLYVLQLLQPGLWLETQLDLCSVQATMLHGRATNWVARMRNHRTYFGRIAE